MLKLVRVYSEEKAIQWILDQECQLFGDAGLNRFGLIPLAQNQFCFLAVREDQFLGYALFLEDLQHRGFLYLFSFGIESSKQGMGLGMDFGKLLKEWSCSSGYLGWTLTVAPKNHVAQKIYAKLGMLIEEQLIRKYYGPNEDRLWWKLRFVAPSSESEL